MIYELRVDLFFHDREAIDDIVDKILDHFDDSAVVNPYSDNQEVSTFDIIENHHDEDPNASCQVLAHYDNQPPPIG